MIVTSVIYTIFSPVRPSQTQKQYKDFLGNANSTPKTTFKRLGALVPEWFESLPFRPLTINQRFL
jgi:hypothetical protein